MDKSAKTNSKRAQIKKSKKCSKFWLLADFESLVEGLKSVHLRQLRPKNRFKVGLGSQKIQFKLL